MAAIAASSAKRRASRARVDASDEHEDRHHADAQGQRGCHRWCVRGGERPEEQRKSGNRDGGDLHATATAVSSRALPAPTATVRSASAATSCPSCVARTTAHPPAHSVATTLQSAFTGGVVHSPRGFVEQRDVRSTRKHRGDGGALPLAAAQVPRIALREIGKAELCDEAAGVPARPVGADRPRDLGGHCRAVEQRHRILWQERNSTRRSLDGARNRGEQPRDGPQ